PGSIAGRAGLRAEDELVRIDARPVASQRDVMLGLLDAVSTRAPITFEVRGSDGALREATLQVGDAAQRLRLTEPSGMMSGLGLRFYEPPIPAILGAVEPNGPAELA